MTVEDFSVYVLCLKYEFYPVIVSPFLEDCWEVRPTLNFFGSHTLVPVSCCLLLAFLRRTNLFYFLAKY